jgi:hypothetical protein
VARDLQPIKTYDLSQFLGGRQWVSASIGAGGEAVLLLADASASVILGRWEQPGWTSFPDSSTSRPVTATVLFHTGEHAWEMELPSLGLPHPRVQPRSRGDVLPLANSGEAARMALAQLGRGAL